MIAAIKGVQRGYPQGLHVFVRLALCPDHSCVRRTRPTSSVGLKAWRAPRRFRNRYLAYLKLRAPFRRHYSSMQSKSVPRPNAIPFWRLVLAGLAALTVSANVSTAAEGGPTIGEMLKTGWQIAGYSQALDNRSTFILFRHPDQAYLVQCRVGYDVTRTPSTYSICYKLQ